jgi:CRP-like cAMP-binding protein
MWGTCHSARVADMISIMSPEIERIFSVLRTRALSFGSEQCLFHLGDPVEVIHFVEAGAVQLTRHQRDGSVLLLQRAYPGSVVAEASLYAEVYHCGAVAAGPTRTRAVAKADLRQRLQMEPLLYEAWARHLARELQSARLHAEILSLKTVAQRLDAWLAGNEGALSRRGAGKTIAGHIGVSPEALYREVAKRRRSSLRLNSSGPRVRGDRDPEAFAPKPAGSSR